MAQLHNIASQADLVQRCEKLLARAKNGDLVSLAFVAAFADESVDYNWFAPASIVHSHYALTGLVATLLHFLTSSLLKE